MGVTSTTATRLIGPIYAPDGSVLFDPSSQSTSQLNAKTWAGAPNNIAEATGSYFTTSSTIVSSGIGLNLGAQVSANNLIRATGYGYSNTSGNSYQCQVYRNTTGVPGAGGSVGTDTLITSVSGTPAGVDYYVPFAMSKLDTGLTAATTYYYYVALLSFGGGTDSVTIYDVTLIAESR